MLDVTGGEVALSQLCGVVGLDALGSAIDYEFLQTCVVLNTEGIQVSLVKALLECHICLHSIKINILTVNCLLIIIAMIGYELAKHLLAAPLPG